MIFKRKNKQYFYQFFLLTLTLPLLTLSIDNALKTVAQTSNFKIISHDNTDSKKTEFHFVNDDLSKQFVNYVHRVGDVERSNYILSFFQPTNFEIYNIFQTYVRNYLAWHWTSESTWQTPIHFILNYLKIPIFNPNFSHLNFGQYVSNKQLGDYSKNDYLFGNFPTDQFANKNSWEQNQIFDLTKFVQNDLTLNNEDDTDVVGLANLKFATQPWEDSLKNNNDGKYIDLAELKNHQFGDALIDNVNFPTASIIRDWKCVDKNKPLSFSSVVNHYSPLLTNSSWSATFDDIWDASIKNFVSHKTLLLIKNKTDDEENILRKIPTLNVSKLFQLGEIGYDHQQNKYWYTIGFNQFLLFGLLGAYYNSDIGELLDLDTSNSVINIDLINFHYWQNLSNDNENFVISGGIGSWINIAQLNSQEKLNYSQKIHDLVNYLKLCILNKQLTYDNYFIIKSDINNYVENTHTIPTIDWLNSQFKNNKKWKNNGWVDAANHYHLRSSSIKYLAMLLPLLHFSQFSMFDTTGNNDWNNYEQAWNIGTKGKLNQKYFNFDDLVNNKLKTYINFDDLKLDKPIKLVFNVGIQSELQSSSIFDFQNNFPETQDIVSGGKYLKCNLENIENIKILSNNNIRIKNDSTFINKDNRKISNFNYIQINRDGEKIVPLNDLRNKHLTINEHLQSQLPSIVWSKAQNNFPNDTTEALKSIFHDENQLRALPFARVDLWNNNFLDYNIPNSDLSVKADDITGSLIISLKNTDKMVHVKGFKMNTEAKSSDSDHQSSPTSKQPKQNPLKDKHWNEQSPKDKDLENEDKNSYFTSTMLILSAILGGCGLLGLMILFLLKKCRKMNKKAEANSANSLD